MSYWLMKSEPDVFSFRDLVASPNQTAEWEGVRNFQARNFMRDQFAIGDGVLFYHSNASPSAIVGTAKVVRAAYPDPTALDPKSNYFDKKSQEKGESRWVMVDIQAVSEFERPLALADLREEPSLRDMYVIRRGMRLSIQPVTSSEWKKVNTMGSSKAKD